MVVAACSSSARSASREYEADCRSVAAGSEKGGYDDVFEAAKVMGKVKDLVYYPNTANSGIYDKLFAEYKILHDYFGRGENDVMKRLKALK